MEVQVNDVEAHVARTNDSDDRVEVRSVVIEQSADLVYRLRYLPDVALEETERVRVRKHQAGNVVIELGLQRVEVDESALIRRHLLRLEAGKRDACGIRAVGGVGDDHAMTRGARRIVERAHDQKSGQLALCAGGRLERQLVHPGRLAQRGFERAE
jgi:hypothetical protein